MMGYATIDDVRGDERIDSRDLIELRDSLRSELEYTSADSTPSRDELREAIEAIDALEAEGFEDWEYGAFFIREDTFEDYARELAEDIGAIPDDAQWPATCIDWARAARELSVDYSSTRFLGHDYYVR
jgi:hypothetical protein